MAWSMQDWHEVIYACDWFYQVEKEKPKPPARAAHKPKGRKSEDVTKAKDDVCKAFVE